MDFNDRTNVAFGLSGILNENARSTSAEILEQRLLSTMERLSSEEADSFTNALSDVGQFFKSNEVRNIAGTALPILGTAVGTAYGGPAGGAIGGTLGGLAGHAIGGSSAPHPPVPAQPAAAVPPSGPVASSAPPTGPAASAPSPSPTPQGGSTAAAQLLNVIQNPATLSGLLALVLGRDGKTSVPVGSGDTQVPVGALMNLLSVLANRAAEDADDFLAAAQDPIPAYLYDEKGCLACDPAVPSQRADALLHVLSARRPRQEDDAWHTDEWWF